MESLFIVTLLTSGYYLSQNKQNRKLKKQNSYNNNEEMNYDKVNEIELDKNTNNHIKALDPNNTNVIPPNMNDEILNEKKYENSSNKIFSSLTGTSMDEKDFKHNNMVPFFGSNSKASIKEESYDSILDNYIGTGSQQIAKTEQGSLFAPQENMQWAYGAPNNNEFMLSRVNPSMRRANETPFESIKDAPGLGLNGESAGFNSGVMSRDTWKPKTVDDLRVRTNPKSSGLSLLNHEGPGASKIQNRGHIGLQEKNRPMRMYENTPDKWFTTTGAEQGRTLRAEPVLRVVNRPETTTDYAGNAVSLVGGEYIPGQYMPSTNIELGEKPLGVPNATGNNNPHQGDYGLDSKRAYPNNRSENEQPNFFGAVGTTVSAAVSPLLDILRPSRKENVIGNMRPYQNPGSTVPESYIFNPADRTKTTHRETMEESKRSGNINTNQLGGAYQSTQHQVAYTNRNITGDFMYSGNANGNRAMKSDVAELNQRNNDLKSSTIKGRLQAGNMSLYNGEINSRQSERDEFLKNDRPIAANRNGMGHVPNKYGMGQLAGKDNSLYQTINMDRNNADLLKALKSNPYVTNYKSAL